MTKNDLKVHFSSKKDDWETPDDFFQAMERLFGKFDFDAASSINNHKCEVFLSPELDYNALEMNWVQDVVSRPNGTQILAWLNPPYNKPEKACKSNCLKVKCKERGHITKYIPGQIDFVRKAHKESLKGCKVVCLLPARPDTDIFKLCFNEASEIYFIQGRLKFKGAKDAAPFPSMVVVFDRDIQLPARRISLMTSKGEVIGI